MEKLLLLALYLAFPSMGGDSPDFLQDEPKLISHVNEKASALDWKTALSGAERVFYLGESHHSGETRRELVRSMKSIKEAGITHFAMEMLAEEYADAVRKYCCDGSCDKNVFESFEKFGWDEQAYMATAEAAQEAGLKLVAIDLPYAIRKAVSDRTRQLERSDDTEAIKEYCRLKEDIYAKRDERMAKNIADALKADPKARVLVLVGARHALKSNQPKVLTEKHGLASKSFVATSGNSEIIKALNKTKRRDDALFIPMPVEKMEFDAYINFPIAWGVQRSLAPKKAVGSH
jgi:uncharacterized iron-regulated protein